MTSTAADTGIRRRRSAIWTVTALAACLLGLGSDQGSSRAAAQLGEQKVLPPGLFVYQTRTRDGTCPDAPRTGFVRSAIATLDGVPGSRQMTMKLPNSKYWPTWSITITGDNVIIGTANLMGAKDSSRGDVHFELKATKGRFQGVGYRNYFTKIDGKRRRCTLNFDALLKPMG